MKRLILAISVLALLLFPVGCTDIEGMVEGIVKDTIESMLEDLTATYTIRVSGNISANFTGEYEAVSATFDAENWVDYSIDSYSVSEEIPSEGYVEYTVIDAISVVGMFQKQDDDDALLRVELWRGDELVDASETDSPWGAVLAVAFSSESA